MAVKVGNTSKDDSKGGIIYIANYNKNGSIVNVRKREEREI